MRKWLCSALVLVVVAGCSDDNDKLPGFPSFNDVGDYRNAAVEAINDSAELEDGVCEEPDSIDIGTTFDCTSTLVADGSTVALNATIDRRAHVMVDVAED